MICKPCQNGRHLKCKKWFCGCDECFVEPVAEPAEPSASPDDFHAGGCNEHCRPPYGHYYPYPQTAPHPVAAYLKDCVKEETGCDCVNVCKFDAQPVAACTGIVACTQKEACLKVNRCLINLPQPVAGEEPRCQTSTWCTLENDHQGNCEGTPKLEEIATTIQRKVWELWQQSRKSSRTSFGQASYQSFVREEVTAILRPFITPACQKIASTAEQQREIVEAAQVYRFKKNWIWNDERVAEFVISLATPSSTGEAADAKSGFVNKEQRQRGTAPELDGCEHLPERMRPDGLGSPA